MIQRSKAAFVGSILIFACLEVISAQSHGERDVIRAVRSMFSNEYGEVRYFLKWSDLNEDGTPEAIVHVVGPGVCGSGGCGTLIFSRTRQGFRLVSEVGLTRPLIMASPRRTQGWHNLIVFVAGGGILPGYYAELRFDGGSYPKNPTVEPATPIKGKPDGTVLIPDYRVYTQGKLLIAAAR